MRRWLLSLVAVFLCAPFARAQFTAVSAQVTDPSGNIYAGCRANANFVPAPTATTQPLISGSVFPTTLPLVQCDSFGQFSVTLVDNNQVSDGHSGAASQWRFNITSPDGKTGFSCTITITGATQNISAALKACAAPLFNATNSETINFPGSLSLIGSGGNPAPLIVASQGNPALNGEIRFGNVDMMNWRNAANTADFGIGLFNPATGNVPVDTFGYGGPGVNGHFLSAGSPGNAFNVAASGDVRVASGGSVSWRNNANSADIALNKDTSDQLRGDAFAGVVFSNLVTGNNRLLCSSTNPSVSSGFNVGSVGGTSNGSCSFTLTVGTGAAVSTGVLSLPSTTNGWNCWMTNQTRADFVTQSGSTSNSATMQNWGTTFTATNWTNSDQFIGGCTAR